MEMGNRAWFVLYTKPKNEKRVARLLTIKGVESYCPLTKVTKQWSDRKKTLLEPLFKSYVFVRLGTSEMQLAKQTPGVVNLLFWLGSPARIKDDEIEAIKNFVDEFQSVRILKTQVNVNDFVRVIGGPLRELRGQVVSIVNKSVKLLLPSLGYLMIADIQLNNVEIDTTITTRRQIETRIDPLR